MRCYADPTPFKRKKIFFFLMRGQIHHEDCPYREDNIKDFLKCFYQRLLVLIYWMYFTSPGHLSKSNQTMPLVENFTVC